MDGLLILLLFGVFAVSILAVLLSGAGVYRRLAERDDRSYDRRTAVQYVATRVRQADQAGGVSVRTFEGCPALILSEEIEGELYETRIYHYDGYIRELFVSAGRILGLLLIWVVPQTNLGAVFVLLGLSLIELINSAILRKLEKE